MNRKQNCRIIFNSYLKTGQLLQLFFLTHSWWETTYRTGWLLLGHGWLPWNKELGEPYAMLQIPDLSTLQMSGGGETTWQSGRLWDGHNHQSPEWPQTNAATGIPTIFTKNVQNMSNEDIEKENYNYLTLLHYYCKVKPG